MSDKQEAAPDELAAPENCQQQHQGADSGRAGENGYASAYPLSRVNHHAAAMRTG